MQILGVESVASSAAGNDDRAGHDGNLAWVIDGATDLVDAPLVGARSDAEWLAEFAGRWLAQCPPDRRDGALRQVLLALTGAAAAAVAGGARRQPAARHEHPSAAMALVRQRRGKLDILAVGDCTVLIRRGEAVQRFGTDETDAGDQWLQDVIRARRSEAAQDRRAVPADEMTSEPLRALLMEDLRKARRLMNQPGGYGVLSITMPPSEFVTDLSIEIGAGDAVLLASDGFMRLADVFARYRTRELFAAAETRGLASLIDELREIEAGDAACLAYPRAKMSDDATAILLIPTGQ